MLLPVMPPVAPMLAKSVPQIPEGSLSFEPKWDGFRSIVFRDGGEVEIGSRNERPMTRYFPEVVEAIKQSMPERCVVDGEIIVVVGDRLEFEVLQQRIHPAASRIKLLSEETPARFVAFDLLALDDIAYTHEPFEKRRSILESLGDAQPPIHLTPATRDHDLATKWFSQFEGAGLDGVVAKPLNGTYQPDKDHVQDQAPADGGLCGGRVPRAQERPGQHRLPPSRPVQGGRRAGQRWCDRRLSSRRRKELFTELQPLVTTSTTMGLGEVG